MRCDWEVVKRCFEAQPNFADYIPSKKNGLFPVDEDMVFRALNLVGSPRNVRIIIVGQDPYPRAESAVGISFLDGAVESFQSPRLAPSVRHVLQAIVVSRKLMGPQDNVDKLRAVLKDNIGETQTEWFTSLATRCGVLWLNRSLTFGGKDPKTLQVHLTFWKPVIETILEEVVRARASSGLIVLLWGAKAADLRPVLVGLANKHKNCSMKLLLNVHPLGHTFPGAGVFEAVKKVEEELKMGVTDFLSATVSKHDHSDEL